MKDKLDTGLLPELLTKRGVAHMLAMSPRKIDALTDLPRIRFSKRCIRYPRQAVLDWLARRTVGL